MKALITGAYGFIGRNLFQRLMYDDCFSEIILLSRRLRTKIHSTPNKTIKQYAIKLGSLEAEEESDKKIRNLLRTEKPDVIFHLAGNPTVKTDPNNPNEIIADNITSTHQLAYHAPEGCNIVLASSVIVYGNWLYDEIGLKPYNEEHRTEPISVYGATKRASESILDSYVEAGKIKSVYARMCATVGNGLTHGVVFDFIRKLYSVNPNLEALGDEPGSFKPYCHIRDVVNALALLAKSEASGAYNIVPDDYINISEVASAVMKGLGINKPVKFLGSKSNWKGDNKYLICDNKKLKELGWSLKFPNSYDAIVDVVSQEYESTFSFNR